MRDSAPQHLGEFIKLFLKKSGLTKSAVKLNVTQAWEAALGDPKALPHTRPGTVRSGILKVEIATPVLLQQLNFRRRELVKRLAEAAPEAGVRDIRFVVGNFRRTT